MVKSQIKKTLENKRKFNTAPSTETFIKKIEAKLFNNQKSIPWNDLIAKAATSPDWDWHHPNALEDAKQAQLRKDLWRFNGGWIEKGPFPQPPTEVDVKVISRNPETGKAELKITPLNGDTIYYDYGRNVSEACPVHDYHQPFSTEEMEVQFLCVDSEGENKTGDPKLWINEITLQHKFVPQGKKSCVGS